MLVSANRGRLLEPAITIPPDATDLVISSDGFLSVRQAGSERRGPLRQGFLESSNAELDGELFELRQLESHRRALVFAIELLVPNYFGHR